MGTHEAEAAAEDGFDESEIGVRILGDQQHPRLAVVPARGGAKLLVVLLPSRWTTGIEKWNRVPFPGSESTPIVPSSFSTIIFEMASPSPVPDTKSLSLTNRSKILRAFSGGMPMPVSWTKNSTHPSFRSNPKRISPLR